jgi:hypothetical protein
MGPPPAFELNSLLTDGATPTQHETAGVRQRPAVQGGLGGGRIVPVLGRVGRRGAGQERNGDSEDSGISE